MGFRYGFKSEAEKLSLEIREEMGLTPWQCLNAFALAEHLGISVISLSELAELQPEATNGVATLRTQESSAVSAFTVLCDAERIVVFNDIHSPERNANSITHELGHGLLIHPASPALDIGGCRNWNRDLEDEASYLAGTLLIPGKAVRGSVTRGLSEAEIAARFGCSIEVARMRVNLAGGRRLAS